MAYGMSSAELARVGQNVNRQSGGVSDQSIAEAMDKELSEERKEAVGRFQARKRSAVKEDAKQKAKLRSNLVKAVVKSGVKAAEAGAFSKKPKAPEIAPVEVKTEMKDNLTTGKPQPRLKLSGPTRKGPDVRSEAYARQSAKGLRQIKRMGRRSKGDGTAETDSELLALLED